MSMLEVARVPIEVTHMRSAFAPRLDRDCAASGVDAVEGERTGRLAARVGGFERLPRAGL